MRPRKYVDPSSRNAYLTAMSLLPIVHIPDPVLRKKSAAVARVDDQLRKFIDNMFQTMYDAPGIGLAAVQVGEPLRIFTVDCAKRSQHEDEDEDEEAAAHGMPARDVEADGDGPAEPEHDPIVLINPEIVSWSDERNVYEEGCLSIPDYYADVERPAGCVVKFLDRDGKQQILQAEGLLATVIQHEFDHLNGILFVDHISKLKRDMVIRKFTKIAKQSGTQFIG
jgi:peptide deformylase